MHVEDWEITFKGKSQRGGFSQVFPRAHPQLVYGTAQDTISEHPYPEDHASNTCILRRQAHLYPIG